MGNVRLRNPTHRHPRNHLSLLQLLLRRERELRPTLKSVSTMTLKTLWLCGCVTWKDGETFYITPCSFDCKVYKFTIAESKRRFNRLEWRINRCVFRIGVSSSMSARTVQARV